MEEYLQLNDSNGKVRILVVDDHSIVRRGLTQLINHESDLRICAEAANAMQALAAIREQPFDLAMVDISLDDMDGIELAEKIKLISPDLPVLILTMHDEAEYAERALRAGAEGYVTKNEAAEKIVTAIRQVLCGRGYISKTVRGRLSKKSYAEKTYFS
ncbi:MAG: response regulator [Planctomycetota bacterium]|jgi:DNA-binding NarL/FixJ family response regulator